MTGLFIVFMSAVAGVMGGLALSKRFSARERYFTELDSLIDRLISDIMFAQDAVEKILSAYMCQSEQLSGNIDEYIGFIHGKELKLSRGVLSRRELHLVEEFFLRLGTLDLDTQINELNARKTVFAGMKAESEKKNKSYGRAAIKLGFLAGLLVGILLL